MFPCQKSSLFIIVELEILAKWLKLQQKELEAFKELQWN